MTQLRAGQIVWHDLFTSDRERSMAFYRCVANWTYQVERATDFAWGGGERDFVLALSGDEAGAGFAETPPNQKNGWISYIEVPDVDAAVKCADTRGGRIVRQPFDVPGVGRNALVCDPLGALLGISLSRHSFPVPRRQFGPDLYISSGGDFPERFYAELFGWRVSPMRRMGDREILRSSGDPVAVRHGAAWPAASKAAWVPGIRAASVSDARRVAETHGARSALDDVDAPVQAKSIILCDPDGAIFALVPEQTSTL